MEKGRKKTEKKKEKKALHRKIWLRCNTVSPPCVCMYLQAQQVLKSVPGT